MSPRALAVAATALAAISSQAATKVDEGFATRVTHDGRFMAPADRITEAIPGSEVIYWIQWKDHPVGHTSFRCRIVDDADGEVLIDEEQTYEDSRPEGYSVCGWQSSPQDDPQSYTFSQYLNGEKVGELAIRFRKTSFWSRLGVYGQFKYALGGLALVILALHWLRKRSASRLAGDRPAGPGVVIGSKRSDIAAAAAAPPPASAPDELGLDAFRRRLAADPSFRPARAEDAFTLAKAARKAGDPKLAVAALRGFDKAFPGHALVPEVYVFSAKLMAEDLGNTEMARKILAHVVQKYPGHFVATEARALLQSLPG